uniref:Uncharacterized protein n=2 Tax=viral metagenome TaxID=1070528 RepID=A0A6M3KVA3_9ZZZZ
MWFVRKSRYKAAVEAQKKAERTVAYQHQVIADSATARTKESLKTRLRLNKALHLLTPAQREEVMEDDEPPVRTLHLVAVPFCSTY